MSHKKEVLYGAYRVAGLGLIFEGLGFARLRRGLGRPSSVTLGSWGFIIWAWACFSLPVVQKTYVCKSVYIETIRRHPFSRLQVLLG